MSEERKRKPADRTPLEVREVKGFTGADGLLVRVFKVYNPRDSWDGLQAQVWIGSDGKPACTVCSGPLSAMLSTCRHCCAVRRYLKRAEEAAREQEARMLLADAARGNGEVERG